MKNLIKFFGLGILFIIFLAGCSKPEMEMSAAKTAIENAISEGADIYAKPELEALQAEMTTAEDLVEAKSKNFSSNFNYICMLKCMLNILSDFYIFLSWNQ